MQTEREHHPGQPRQAPCPPSRHVVNMLRAHPIRTVEEERQELFKGARPCAVPVTTFARTVDGALRACFALLKFTDHIQVVYVQGSTGKVDLYFDKGQGMLNIHCRWLDFACTHHRSFCRPCLRGRRPILLLSCGGRALGSINCTHVQSKSVVSTSRNKVHGLDGDCDTCHTASS
jgi:hypothetical protein